MPGSDWLRFLRPLAAVPVLVCCGWFVAHGHANAPGARLRDVLSRASGLSPAELGRVDRGQVVARSMDAADPREIATVGVVQLGVSPDDYIRALRDVARLKRDEAVLQIGVFSNPATRADVARLTLEPADLNQLRACRVDDCEVQLPAATVVRLQQEIGWSRPDAAERANDLFRTMLVEYVAAYQLQGAAAVMEYADRETRTDVALEFAALLGTSGSAWQALTPLRDHLLAPRGVGSAAGFEDLIYWSKEKMGKRPVVTVTHLAITRPAGEAEFAVASKHLYGSHYIDASLGLTLLYRDPAIDAPHAYLVYLNRSRIDLFDGFFGKVARGIVRSRARATVATQLERLRQRVTIPAPVTTS